ncbi:MAG: hypothetical protein CL912_20630, partial [Deltaproteobacteria bacterium]|nr:hypothetical protein [Deltaproteobacteria bacterium]
YDDSRHLVHGLLLEPGRCAIDLLAPLLSAPHCTALHRLPVSVCWYFLSAGKGRSTFDLAYSPSVGEHLFAGVRDLISPEDRGKGGNWKGKR